MAQINKTLVKTTKATIAELDKQPTKNQSQKHLKKLVEAVNELDIVSAKTIAESDASEVVHAAKQADDDRDVVPDSSTIASVDEFFTCSDVVELEPKACKDTFLPGKVYVFARIRAPETQTLTLKWFDMNDEAFAQRELKIKKNLQNGFRTYTWKNIWQPGSYHVRLYDQGQQQIGREDFTIE